MLYGRFGPLCAQLCYVTVAWPPAACLYSAHILFKVLSTLLLKQQWVIIPLAVILRFAVLSGTARHVFWDCIYPRQRHGLYRCVYDWIKPELKSGFICWEKTILHLLLIAAFESQFLRVSRYKKICLLALFTMSKLLPSGDGFEITSLGYSAIFVMAHM